MVGNENGGGRRLLERVRSLFERRKPSAHESQRGESDGAKRSRFESDGISPAELHVDRGLSRSAYVLELVNECGGWMRQQQIIRATGWSKYAVSRLLSEMEADDEIARVRVGNEKVVLLPHRVPERYAGSS